MEKSKWVYAFTEGDASMNLLLGGKGANLCQMTRNNFPVPSGFIITTEACREYFISGKALIQNVEMDIREAVEKLENENQKKFGSKENPLLLSVRSGAPVSMPGMMNTILNLGLNDETVVALATKSSDERFAYDSYRRFIQMYANVVFEVELELFEDALRKTKEKIGVTQDFEIDAPSLKILVKEYKKILLDRSITFPIDPWDQLRLAIEAVFKSWNTPRAKTYRKIHGISEELGTAVTVQSMVFGNLGKTSATGVCFTRNPSTGEKKLFGEYLLNAQGEDVVAGIRTPNPIQELQAEMPAAYSEFYRLATELETEYKDMQDIEFTVQEGKLYILQTRSGKRTAAAAVKVAMDLYHEGLIAKNDALRRVTPEQISHLMHPQIDPKEMYNILAKGLPASPGAGVGAVAFDADDAVERTLKGEKIILVRPETTPDDIHGLFAAEGVLTSHGGMTSHAAVVARGLGKPCVSGAGEVRIDLAKQQFSVGDTIVRKGDIISLDASQGHVILGELSLIPPVFSQDFHDLLEFADEVASLKVYANADSPEDAQRALNFGAKGIGLCRTEHMFMQSERLVVMQDMIVAEKKEDRMQALAKLEKVQKEDFLGIFKEMSGLSVTVRLLDPPLHEFLPKIDELRHEEECVGDNLRRAEIQMLIKRSLDLHEMNPMLGFRGCRLGMVYPEIYEMQARAILAAAHELQAQGVDVHPEIMIPLVGTEREMSFLRELVDKQAECIATTTGHKVHYRVGTMIEIPRAVLVADKIAETAEFFSFGTNDLTQTTFAYSRDDAENKFLQEYIAHGVLKENPFEVLDREGVGALMKMATEKGRAQRADIKIGICGEHGGNPSSIAFCHQLGLDYVSCSPFRVPVARLAAAHSALGLIH